MRSAVVVTVPQAEPVVGGWRLQHTKDAPAGMPAHVTLLFPFVRAEHVEKVEPRLTELVAAARPFDFTFRRTARFAELLYLAPEPAEPFVALTEAIATEWPEHPPYEGMHDAVIPHLTVAGSDDSGLLDEIAADVERQLPLVARVREASVFVEDEHARWREHSRLLLRDAA